MMKNNDIKVGDKFTRFLNTEFPRDFYTVIVRNINEFREPDLKYAIDIYDMEENPIFDDYKFVGEDFFEKCELNKTITTNTQISLMDVLDSVESAMNIAYPKTIEGIRISPNLYTYMQNSVDFSVKNNEENILISSIFGIPIEIDLTLNDFNYKIIKKGEK